tara:strand:- start:8436 stop:8936 length:501 start_codon:yes stop_codon:yes gene_type:complete
MSILYKGLELKNATLEQLYNLFRSIGREHFFIQTTTIGDIFEVDLVETTYPLMHVSTNTATFSSGQIEHSFQVVVMDLVNKDENNEEEVLSDMLQVIGDVLSVLLNSDYDTDYTDFRHEIRIQENITCEPFTERFDNEVTGWTADINIVVAFDATACAGGYVPFAT